MNGLIQPLNYVDIQTPIIFLAGPITNAPKWQESAAEYLLRKDLGVVVASPCWDEHSKLQKHLISGDTAVFERARAWEKHYYGQALVSGCVLLWLPGQEKHTCDKDYAAMTRFETGYALGAYAKDKTAKFVIGSDWTFSEMHTIAYDVQEDAPDHTIYESLEQTCDAAINTCLTSRCSK